MWLQRRHNLTFVQVGLYDNLKDVALRILQDGIATIPIISAIQFLL